MVKAGASFALFAAGLAAAAAIGFVAPGCQPNLDDTVSIVTTARVLAIQSVPAEAPPAAKVAYTALIAQGSRPDGGPDAGPPPLSWDYCNARNPLKNLGPVSTLCVQQGNSALVSFGGGPMASGAIPDLSCANFGPNPPPAMDGGMAGQPVNPDFTGGYYQPVSAFLGQGRGAVDTLYLMRLSCGFAGANEASQAVLTARYHANENPEVLSLSANGTTLTPLSKGGTNPVTHGQKITLEVAWPTCPLTDRCGDGVCGADESAVSCPTDCASAGDGGASAPPKGCAGAERFVNFDLTSQTVVDQREGIHVSWYATAGAFQNDRTGRQPSDDATTSDDVWTAPAQAGQVQVWVVLRDDRGGIGWEEYALEVQ
jgi:hypothetical protein